MTRIAEVRLWLWDDFARIPLSDAFGDYLSYLGDGTGARILHSSFQAHSRYSDILARKRYHDLTGNGVNHPNDYGHRLYVRTRLGMPVVGALVGASPLR